MANTHILVKRSSTTAIPTSSSLQSGELAYSYSSNTAFIGNSDGVGVLKIGGQAYTSAIDAATNANTGSTIVKRDVNGQFSGNLIGNATSASSLISPQNFSISSGDISSPTASFSGNNAVVLNATLSVVPGLANNSVGSATAIPVITYGANGRILGVTTAAISSTITVSGNTGSDTLTTGSTLTVQGGSTGITTAVTGSAGAPVISINTDNTVVRSNTSSVGPQVINTDLSLPTTNVSVGGTLSVTNLNISGNVIQYNSTSTLNVADPIIYLAANNSGNSVDIGLAGHFVGAGSSGFSHYQHTGFVRDFNDNKWKLFSNVSAEPTTTVTFDATTLYDVIKTGGLDASGGAISNVSTISASSLALTTALPVSSGGTGVATLPSGQVLLGFGTGNVSALSNVSAVSSTVASNQTVNTLNSDVYGRVTSYTTQAISGLTVSQGGTGASTFNLGSILVGNGTGAVSVLANTGTAGTYGSASYLPVITTDAYGRVSNVANTQVILDLTSTSVTNTLPFIRGGTGSTSYTTGQMLIAGSTGFLSLANSTYTATGSGATNSTVTSLTVDAYGRVTAATYSAISGLTVSQGGTGISTATTNGITFGNGTGAFGVTAAAGTSDQTWSNQILTVTNAGVPTWSNSLDGGVF